jgi:predicted outer membrane repeat protein
VYVRGTFIMSGGEISDNTAYEGNGGGVYVAEGGNFTMRGGTISGNTATSQGGGVYVAEKGTFRIVIGTIYGSDEANTSLKNNAGEERAGAALYNAGTAQRGTFSGNSWSSSGNLNTTDNTIRVMNGALQ